MEKPKKESIQLDVATLREYKQASYEDPTVTVPREYLKTFLESFPYPKQTKSGQQCLLIQAVEYRSQVGGDV